ncbi:MAG: hypothetical protein H6Q00_1922 [Holophagaceae bacterium]|nr:hypothetical protein [Holophagaceae bacterium]
MATISVEDLKSLMRSKLATNPEKVAASGLQGVMQFDFREDGNGQFHIVFDQGRAQLVDGGHTGPRFKLIAPFGYFEAMFAGVISPEEADQSGKINMQGFEPFGRSFGEFFESLRYALPRKSGQTRPAHYGCKISKKIKKEK